MATKLIEHHVWRLLRAEISVPLRRMKPPPAAAAGAEQGESEVEHMTAVLPPGTMITVTGITKTIPHIVQFMAPIVDAAGNREGCVLAMDKLDFDRLTVPVLVRAPQEPDSSIAVAVR